MLLTCAAIALVLVTVLALLPLRGLPGWLNVYVGVAAVCGLVVVGVALVA